MCFLGFSSEILQVVELEATSATVRHALAVLTKDESIGALEAKLRAMSAELEALRKALGANELLLCEQTQTRADVERRDEQLEFLVNARSPASFCCFARARTASLAAAAPVKTRGGDTGNARCTRRARAAPGSRTRHRTRHRAPPRALRWGPPAMPRSRALEKTRSARSRLWASIPNRR